MPAEPSAQNTSGFQASLNQAGLALAGGLTLQVETGIHAGAKLIQRSGRISVGSSLNNDMVLLADALAPNHYQISVTDALRGIIRIEAREDAFRTSDGRSIDSGRYVDLQIPARFQAGNAEFKVTTARNISGIQKKIVLPGIALLFLALTLPSVLGWITSGTQTAFQPDSVQTQVSEPNPAMLDEWLEKLRGRVSEAGLAGQVTIEKGAVGNLVALGSIDNPAMDRWRDVIKWYDSQGAGPLLISNIARTDAPASIPQFRAVWVDARPQVILPNGQSAGVGDTIPGGWKIEGIEASGVLLSRDGRTTKVTF